MQAHATLKRSATVGTSALLLGTGVVGCALALLLPVSPLFVPKALSVLVFWLALVLPSLAEHGHPTLGPANAITLLRGGWTALLAAFVLEPIARDIVQWLVLTAGFVFFLDWVDGRVARATGWASPFGARLDMELDALTVLSLCALVWDLGHAGPWVMLSGALRYLFVAAGIFLPWMNRPLFPAKRRAYVCGVQVVCLMGALTPWPLPSLSGAFAAVGLLALLGSFGVDTAWLVSHRRLPI